MPSNRVVFHPEAEAEVLYSSFWYAKRSDFAAARFDSEVEQAVDAVVSAPNRWPVFIHGTRRCVLRRFPFSLVYRYSDGEILIVAVAHAKRRPGYWKERL